MRVLVRSVAVAAIVSVSPAQAEVVASNANGFEIRQSGDLAVPPAAAFRTFEKIGGWWNPDHTYSGKAANLSLALKPGGCFCETLPGGGGIEHLRVAYVDPGKRAVLTGGLGPLLFEATAGVLDVRIAPAGAGSRLTLTYRAAGFAKGGADKLAQIVDQVLGEQVKRLVAAAAKA